MKIHMYNAKRKGVASKIVYFELIMALISNAALRH